MLLGLRHALLAGCFLLLALGHEEEVPTDKAPNIILVLVEPWGLLDGGGGAEGGLQAMPFTQAVLARNGLSLKRFFANTPLSAPSRATLLTGKYVHNLQVRCVGFSGGGSDAAY